MKNVVFLFAVFLFLVSGFIPLQAGEVAIYTGNVGWIDKASADAQALICADRLEDAGITVTLFQNTADQDVLAEWVEEYTNSGEVDVLVLYGYFPESIYPAGNAQVNGSLAELFIESTDGNAILNHADWMFYVSSTNNGAAGLQNMMDIPGITMGNADNLPVTVTETGREISPNLTDFLSDRTLRLDMLSGGWFVEACLAESADGTRADPVIVRDGDRGRLIPVYQTNSQVDPKGAVAADIIAWLFEMELQSSRLGISGYTTSVTGTPFQLAVSLQDETGFLTVSADDVVVDLAADSSMGAFDLERDGAFDGSITSVTVPAGEASAVVYYMDMEAGMPLLSMTSDGLSEGSLELTVFEEYAGTPGEVAIYTGDVNWIDKAAADSEAQITITALNELGISNVWFANSTEQGALEDWMLDATDNGETDVLVIYGHFPNSIYPAGNAMPDGSVAELFIESTDGDAIINHADWMFYVSTTTNSAGGLQNMMDIPLITMSGADNPMKLTDLGMRIAPSVRDFLSDRPLHLDLLEGDWFVEAAIAQSGDGKLADPVIVRDGNRGRIIPVFQLPYEGSPLGEVAVQIIAWLYDADPGDPTAVTLSGNTTAFVDDPLTITIELYNSLGFPTVPDGDLTVTLSSDVATGVFDATVDGAFDGTVTSVTIPEGRRSVEFYYKDSTAGTAQLSASLGGGVEAFIDVTIIRSDDFAPPGQVAIYTGETWWITTGLAYEQAEICINRLAQTADNLEIPVELFDDPADALDLAGWMEEATDNGLLDVLILYGEFPDAIYPSGNIQPDGSIAELFIESVDGDAIINHADWLFYGHGRNGPGGLQNMMDIAGIDLGGFDNHSMTVTDEGREIAPNLVDFQSDRSIPLAQLTGDWLPEKILAESADGSRADPVILRDGPRGRLIPMYQSNAPDQPVPDPIGAVGAEVIAYLMGTELTPMDAPTQLAITGPSTTVAGTPIRFIITLKDDGGIMRPSASETIVTLAGDFASGAFDAAWNGSYDGTVTEVAIPAGEVYGNFYYKADAAGSVNISVTTDALAGDQFSLEVLDDFSGAPGEVAIYTGASSWIEKIPADAQAQLCSERLAEADIPVRLFTTVGEDTALAEWMEDATENGMVDVLVLYGYCPSSIYPESNAQPDGSIAEQFIESTDGDMILNHADWIFYVSSTNNEAGGLQNIMDNTLGITLWGDNTPVFVTDMGAAIAPDLADYLTNRPIPIDMLDGQWFVEAALAENETHMLVDPIVVRDGNRGRIAVAYQTGTTTPKGLVGADMIAWIMGRSGGSLEPLFLRGDSNTDGDVNIADAVFILAYYFAGGQQPVCMDSADANDDGSVNIADAVAVLAYYFAGAGDLAPPFGTCGVDPTDDAIGCEKFTPCE